MFELYSGAEINRPNRQRRLLRTIRCIADQPEQFPSVSMSPTSFTIHLCGWAFGLLTAGESIENDWAARSDSVSPSAATGGPPSFPKHCSIRIRVESNGRTIFI